MFTSVNESPQKVSFQSEKLTVVTAVLYWCVYFAFTLVSCLFIKALFILFYWTLNVIAD